MKNKTILILLAVALLVGIAVVWLASFRKPGHVTADLLNPEATTSVGHLVESEETLLGLTPTLRLLSQSVLNLKLPDENAKTVFSKHAKFEGELESTSETTSSESIRWVVSPRQTDETISKSLVV